MFHLLVIITSAAILFRPFSTCAFSPPPPSIIANSKQSFASRTLVQSSDYISPFHNRQRQLYPSAVVGADSHRLAASSISIGADDLPIEINTTNGSSSSISYESKISTKPPFPLVLWRFTRPHTIIGSAIAIPSIFLLAAPTYSSFFTWRSLASLLYAAVPSLFMNLYITGLNQITDVEIDKINKPYLPIAKGDLKYSTACVVVLIALAISLAMSVMSPIFSSPGLQVALWGSFILGTLYSLPPFRMKKHPLLAAFCIVAVRGTIINAGFYSHAISTAFGASSAVLPQISGVLSCLMNDYKCALSSAFFGVFGIVIALMKDVPDAHGDRIFNIRSFTVRLGQRRVFGTMKNLLSLLFGAVGVGMIKCAAMSPDLTVILRRGSVALACGVAGWAVNKEAVGVNAEDSGEVYSYYMFLWKLFYLSYFVLPFAK